MTHTRTEQLELLPCPFCGGNAHFEIDMDSRWEWVECESCGMQGNSSASLMEDCKPKLREAWNRRTPASQAQRVPLSADEIKEPKNGEVWRVEWWNESLRMMLPSDKVLHRFNAYQNGTIQFTIKAHAHGITQEKQG